MGEYEVPSDEQLRIQAAEQILCMDLCMFRDHCDGFCIANQEWKESMLNLLLGKVQNFLIYFETFSVPTADTLFLLILSILTLESAYSIRFLYQHFLSGITEKSLNVFYYACSYNIGYGCSCNAVK